MGNALEKVVRTSTAPVAVGTDAAANVLNKTLDVVGNTANQGLDTLGNFSQGVAGVTNNLIKNTLGVGQTALQGTGDVLNTTANVAVDAAGKIIEIPKDIVNTLSGVQGGADGGDDLVSVSSVLGGYEDLQKYGDSIYSRSKERLIRDIAYDVFSLLKLPKADRARKAPIEEVVKHLQTVVPNPRKGKHFNDSFNSSAGKQSKMCRALANAINKNYGGQIIPDGLSEHDTCVKVSEVMTSLFTGLHTEFMGVAGDVLRIVRNLETLKQVIDASYKRQLELTNASGDPQLKMQAASVKDFYERVKSELERQLAILTNLVNVAVGPTTKSLIGLLEENRDFSGMVRDLKVDLGTNAFGDKLAYLLSGVSSIAHSAEIIDKALKALGMSVSEFRSAKGISDLRLKVLDHIEKASPTSKELDKMMAAADIIYKNDYNHKKISELLGKKGRGEASGGQVGGDCGCEGGDVETQDDILDSSDLNIPPYAFPVGGKRGKKNKYSGPENKDSNIDNMYHGGSDSDDDDVTMGGNIVGGVDEEDDGLTAYWSRKSLSNKIKKKEKYRELLLKDFRKLLRLHYRNIVEAADSIAKQIAKEIPVTDDLYRFVDVFSAMPSIDSENLHVALSGYPKDSVSRQERDNFMNKYHLLLVTLEPLMKGPGGAYFKDIYHAAANLVKAIDNFSDKMVKAITEIHVDRPEDIRDALKKTATSFFGSGASGAGGEDLFGSGAFVEFRKVQMEMRYYLSIYNIKTNLGRAAEEMKDFGEDYEQILGEEAGWLINQIKREYLALIDDANPYPEPNRPAIAPALNVGVAAVAANTVGAVGQLIRAHPAVAAAAAVLRPGETPATAQERAAKNMFENLRELFTRQMNAKVRMVEVAQAIDLYLRSFADGIARDPDSVKSVIKMLDQVEIVAKWFTDRSGNQLASIFEFFPNNVRGNQFSTGNNADAANAVINAVDEKEAEIKLPMEAENKDHYYAWLNTPAAGVAATAKGPGIPTIGRPLDAAKNRVKGLLTLTDKTIKSMRALENILSAFATVGSKFGDVEPLSKTFMTPGQIFNSLCEYINVSSYTNNFSMLVNSAQMKTPYTQEYEPGAAGIRRVPVNAEVRGIRDNPTALYADGTFAFNPAGPAINNYGVVSGVANNTDSAKKLSIAMASIPAINPADGSNGDPEFWNYHDPANRDRMRNDFAGWLDRFYDTDLLFVMTIKSVVCKIFTVVDAYRLFNRPLSEKNSDQFNSLAPLRTILGGANHVKVLPEALELYLRLPLLVEWYRDKFNFTYGVPPGVPAPAAAPNDWRLAMVPTIDGVWSKFIGLIFDKADYVTDGNYSETQIQKMIVEINDIYRHYKTKYPKATVRNIINSFVIEINRAFGFIKQTEIEAYKTDRRKYLDPDAKYDNGDDPNFNQYDILNAEDQFGRNPAPSDKFVTVAERQKQRRDRNMVHMQKYIVELRKRIDADFRSYTHEAKQVNGQTVVSFVDTLRNYKRELENAKNEKDEYNTVLHIIQGTSNLTNVNPDKLLMLHESVAAPLATLFNVYKVLARYNALLHGTSILNLTAWGENPANVGVIQPDGVAKDRELNRDYAGVLATKYREDRVNNYKNCEMFTNAMLGVFGSNNVNDRRGYLEPAPGAPGAPGTPTAYVPANGNIILNHLNNPNLARDLISALLDLTTNPNGMIRCNISESGLINVDWSALEELCANLLQQVKNNVNQLRIEFTSGEFKDMVNKYTQKEYIGSINWLEECLFEQLFKDRDRTGLSTAHTVHLKSTIGYLTDQANPRVLSLENVFAQLIYYNHRGFSLANEVTVNNLTKFPFNVLSLTVEPESQTPEQKSALIQLRNGNTVGAAPADTINTLNNLLTVPTILFTDTNSINEWNLNINDDNLYQMKSLMLTLNKVIHKYLNDNFDDGTQKIYPGLFETFMNSVASDEIIQKKSFPNVGRLQVPGAPGPITGVLPNIAAALGVGPLFSPAEGSILFESNAYIMQSIMSNMDKLLKKRRHTYDTLAEVPEYLRERMKCNLPIYSKLFQSIFVRADMLRRLLNNTGFKDKLAVLPAVAAPVGMAIPILGMLGVPLQDLGAAIPAAAGGAAALLKRDRSDLRNVSAAGNNSAAQNHKYLDVQLAHICDLTLAIKKCCDGVYKELQDVSPYFMDLSKDFITDYKSRYGAMPFMPASMILLPQLAFNGIYDANWAMQPLRNLLLPGKLNGSTSYKFNLASRVLLARSDVEPQLDHMPGAKELYNNYASVAQKHSMISANDYANTMKLLVYLSRFLNDGAVYCRLFDNKSVQFRSATRANRYPTNSMYGAMYSIGNECAAIVSNAALVVRNVALNRAMQEFLPNQTHPVLGPQMQVELPVGINFATQDDVKNSLSHVEPLCVPMQTLSMIDALNYVENSNKKQSKTEFAKKISGVTGLGLAGVSRDALKVYNILDMGIVPINVHAFMKEVPFTNLLNYSYTFDRMVHDFIAPNYLNEQPRAAAPPPPHGITPANLMIPSLYECKSTREMYVKLLVHPYSSLGATPAEIGRQYYGLIGSLFNGNDNLKLGRPRYLSDQLWHKVLLTSSAQYTTLPANVVGAPGAAGAPPPALAYTNYRVLEAGPQAYEAQRWLENIQQPAHYPAVPAPHAMPNFTAGLKYWSKVAKTWVTASNISPAAPPGAGAGADMRPNNVLYLAELGNVRFNTKLVRNLSWLVNLQRAMRAILIAHLSWIDTPVVRGLKIVDPIVTEYNSNDQFDADEYNNVIDYSVM